MFLWAQNGVPRTIFEKAGRRLQDPCFREEYPRSNSDFWHFVVKLECEKAIEVLRGSKF